MIVSVSRHLYIPFGMSKSERASEQQLTSLYQSKMQLSPEVLGKL